MIGERRQQVAIQTVGTSQDGTGEDLPGTPVTVRTVWARVRKLRGEERVHATQVLSDAEYEVMLTYVDASDLTLTHELLWGSTRLNVLDVEDVDERHKHVRAVCGVKR